MNSAVVNSYFEKLMVDAGYEVRPRKLEAVRNEGRIAENPYFALAFQSFDTWHDLVEQAPQAELELAGSMHRGSSKVWDTYFLMACAEPVQSPKQLNELVAIEYDTRRMRKLVAWGVSDQLTRVDELIRPFVALGHLQVVSGARDPLASLAEKLRTAGEDPSMVARAIQLFRSHESFDVL